MPKIKSTVPTSQCTGLERQLEDEVKARNYGKAAQLYKQISKLKKHVNLKKKRQLKTTHIRKKFTTEEVNVLNGRKFHADWEKKFREFDNLTIKLQKEIKARHRKDLVNRKKSLRKKLFEKPAKYSPAILNELAIEERLVSLNEFEAAQVVKDRVGKMQELEDKKNAERLEKEIKIKLSLVKEKFRDEMKSFNMRREHGKRKLLAKKELDFEKLRKQQRNKCLKLEMEQAVENSMEEKRSAEVKLSSTYAESSAVKKKMVKKNGQTTIPFELYNRTEKEAKNMSLTLSPTKSLGFGSKAARFEGRYKTFVELEELEQLRKTKLILEESKAFANDLKDVFDMITKT